MNSSSEIASTMPEVNRLISSSRRCSSCGHQLDCDKPEEGMVGLPAGLRFDPTDQELIEHLEAKVKEGGSRAHPLIDEFIHTIQGEDGICYTHPEKLPGVTRDGLSKHFFHRSAKAYTTSTRKRRKIQAEPTDLPSSRNGVNTRWHKTGKTRPVMVRGQQKGCKKILVLYTDFGKQRKSEKTSWVMHEYHLGELEGEKEGELLLSKIFYQTQTRNAAIHATVDQHATATRYTAESMPGAIQNGLTGCIDPAAAAAAAMKVQRQQQQLLKQADGQLISSASTKKMFHEEEQHRLQKLDHRSAGLQKLIAACQSVSTKGGTSIHQPKEAQCPYQLCWPPDSQDQHG